MCLASKTSAWPGRNGTAKLPEACRFEYAMRTYYVIPHVFDVYAISAKSSNDQKIYVRYAAYDLLDLWCGKYIYIHGYRTADCAINPFGYVFDFHTRICICAINMCGHC